MPNLPYFDLQGCPDVFGDVLHNYRTGKNPCNLKMTLDQLAMGIHSSKSVIARWEKGREQPPQERVLPPHALYIDLIVETLECSKEQKVRLIRAYACDQLRKLGLDQQ